MNYRNQTHFDILAHIKIKNSQTNYDQISR